MKPLERQLEVTLRAARVLPVLVFEDAGCAVDVVCALHEGGVTVVEVTLRTSAALPALESIRSRVPSVLVGAGTVTSADDFTRARDAGASFVVSPGFSPELARAAEACSVAFLPGVFTPTEIMTARAHGFELLKLFPARPAGGIELVRALGGPFPDVRFCPSGGIRREELDDYLALENVACVGGSWLAPAEAIQARDFARITKLAREVRP